MATKQLEDYSREVLAEFIRREMGLPFAFNSDRLLRRLAQIEAETAIQKNRRAIDDLIAESWGLLGAQHFKEWRAKQDKIDRLLDENERLRSVAFPLTDEPARGHK